jgi:hypothetical protein
MNGRIGGTDNVSGGGDDHKIITCYPTSSGNWGRPWQIGARGESYPPDNTNRTSKEALVSSDEIKKSTSFPECLFRIDSSCYSLSNRIRVAFIQSEHDSFRPRRANEA